MPCLRYNHDAKRNVLPVRQLRRNKWVFIESASFRRCDGGCKNEDYCRPVRGADRRGVSVSRHVAACEKVLKEAGLKTQLHAYGTNIEGEWDAVFAAIKRCHEVVHEMGAPRISTTLKFGTRIDRNQTMDDKVASVQQKLEIE